MHVGRYPGIETAQPVEVTCEPKELIAAPQRIAPFRERYRTTDHYRPPYYNCHLRAYRAVVDAEQTQNDQGSLPQPIRVWHSSRKVHPSLLRPELCVALESACQPD